MDCTFYPAKLSGVCAAPASKSEAHRRMICAGLSRETVCLDGFMESGDMAATERCLQALGADVRREGGTLSLRGFARRRSACRKWTAARAARRCAFSSPSRWR